LILRISSEDKDEMLEAFIAEVSKEMSNRLMREVETDRRTERVRMPNDTRLIALPAYPLTSVTTLRNARVPVFTDLEPWTANEDYIVDEDIGQITILREPEFNFDPAGYPIGPTYFQVIYTGGMAANTDAFIEAFPDLAGACDEQVRYLYQRKDNLGGNSKTSNGETTFTKEYGLLPSVVARIEHHKRGN
jgi:hypothetical protein